MFPDSKIERANSRYLMLSYGKNRIGAPLYTIVETSTGSVIHAGKRKHIVNVWNSRYNYARSRSMSNS